MDNRRNQALDVAKGIGIMLVIAGHLFRIGGTAITVIFTFHMPLFFILSGILYKPETDTKLYIKKS